MTEPLCVVSHDNSEIVPGSVRELDRSRVTGGLHNVGYATERKQGEEEHEVTVALDGEQMMESLMQFRCS